MRSQFVSADAADSAGFEQSVDILSAIKAHENYVKRAPGGRRAQLRFVEVPGIDLTGRRLDEIDLSGACLKLAQLQNTNLTSASLTCADLSEADLSGAILNHADVRGAVLRGATFDSAQMEGADFRPATIAKMESKQTWSIVGGPQGLEGASFVNSSLRGAKLNFANLKGANFNGALLDGASFRGAALGNASFNRAVMIGVKVDELGVPADRLKNCIFDPGPRSRTELPDLITTIQCAEDWVDSLGRRGKPARLDGKDIRLVTPFMKAKKLPTISCRNTIGIGADLSGCELQAANFDFADLRGASFVGADLRGASFRGANLAHADFSKANLMPLALKSGRMLQTDFSEATLERCRFHEALRPAAAKPAEDCYYI